MGYPCIIVYIVTLLLRKVFLPLVSGTRLTPLPRQILVTISFQSVFPTSVTLGVRLSSKVSLVLTFLYLCE